jgi:hypothetical protein
LIRIPVGPELAAVRLAAVAALGAMVLAETGTATAPASARAARKIRSALIAFGIDDLSTATYSRAVPRS